MSAERYPCYVRIGEETSDADELVELPTEKDGTMLLSTIQAQYPEAIGLRFKSESGAWRGVGLSDNLLSPPLEGWGDCEYYITISKTGGKRKFGDSDGPGGKSKKMSEKEMLSDLIVLGLPYAATEDEMKTYFEKFGELDMYEIKMDPQTKKSRGFGFIRFKTVEAVEAVLEATHAIAGRKCEVRFPKKGGQNGAPTKLFIGRLARGTTVEDLREHFSGYGALTDVYIPPQFRGFGFVTFESEDAAEAVLNRTHVINDTFVNVTFPTPKGGQQPQQQMQQQQQQQNMGMQQQQYGYGNMQGQPGQGYTNQGTQGQGYNMQGYGMQGTAAQGYSNQGNMGYSSQGNNMKSYYQQQAGKIQGGYV